MHYSIFKKMAGSRFYVKISLTLLMFLSGIFAYGQQSSLSLWYRTPAAYWEACVPLGNGRLGATPDGGVEKENIILNDITLWSGGKQDADIPKAYQYLPEIQKLILAGDNIKAEELMSHYFKCAGVGSGEGSGAKVPYGCYQMLGNLSILYDYGARGTFANYVRKLAIDSAIASTSFRLNGTDYRREYFASFQHDVIIIRLTASTSHHINFKLAISRPEHAKSTLSNGTLRMTGHLDNGSGGLGMEYLTQVKIKQEGGKLHELKDSLQVSGATTATIYISTATDYKRKDLQNFVSQTLETAYHTNYSTEKAHHIQNFRRFFSRASVTINGNDRSDLPTDERLENFRTDTTDTGLPSLYFQYGRYLLISSTRPGLLPPNLQGLWANTIQTAWNGDYHLDINIQMNHWPLDVTNLGELNQPFYSLVKSLVEPGERTAKAYYNSPGWVAHVITNIWGFTSPGEGYSWGAFNTGSAWLCQMLFTHFEYSNDLNYLKEVYPILKGSARFYLHALAREKEHNWLVTAPSNSPENAFYLPNGKAASVCAGPTIDNQLVRYLFNATEQSARLLNIDNNFRLQLTDAIKQLPPDQIGKNGKLMEWLDDYQATDIHHRHVSPLWGLYPGNEINSQTPETLQAAKALLEERGDVGTGWSLAWKINLWARLDDGDHAFELFHHLLNPVTTTKVNMSNGGGSYINLFCAHPPFQIDGNFGGTAGISEMLLQSSNGYIEILPALPSLWANGSFSGLCVRGGAVVDVEWADHQAKKVRIRATSSGDFKIRLQKGISEISIEGNGKYRKTKIPDDGLLTLKLAKGESVVINK